MRSDLKEYRISEVAELVIDNRGRNPSCYSDSGVPVIDNYLITSEGEPDLSEVKRYISNETYNTFIRKYNQAGDVLITLVGNGYGKVAISPKEKSIIIQNTIGIRAKPDFDNSFLYYLLKGNRTSLMNLNRGAAQPSIKVGDLLEVPFKFPKYNQQKLIGLTLNSLDKKIQKNKQINQTLEQMAQALFKSWFVDFDPVFDNLLASADFNLENLETSLPDELKQKAQRRLAALNSLNNAAECKASLSALSHELQAQLPTKEATQAAAQVSEKAAETPVKANLNGNPKILVQHANTHAHFPNEFEHNEQLGWIPRGWKQKYLSDLLEVKYGKDHKKLDDGSILFTVRADLCVMPKVFCMRGNLYLSLGKAL